MNVNVQNQTMNASQTTPAYDLRFYGTYAVQITWTIGTSTSSTGKVEHSMDGVNWATAANSSFTMDNTGTCHIYEVPQMASNYARFNFTAGGSTGSGTFSVIFSHKGKELGQ